MRFVACRTASRQIARVVDEHGWFDARVPAAARKPRFHGVPGHRSMIVASFGRYLTRTGHDHESARAGQAAREYAAPELAAAGRTGRKSTLAGRARARPASGWFVRDQAREPDWESGPAPGAGSPGQKRAGVFRKLVTRVWA